MKNEHASAMAKIRWSKTSKKDRIAHAKKMVAARIAKKASKNKGFLSTKTLANNNK